MRMSTLPPVGGCAPERAGLCAFPLHLDQHLVVARESIDDVARAIGVGSEQVLVGPHQMAAALVGHPLGHLHHVHIVGRHGAHLGGVVLLHGLHPGQRHRQVVGRCCPCSPPLLESHPAHVVAAAHELVHGE